MCTVNQKTSRLKRAELLSGVGAVVLGMGLGLLLSRFLSSYTTPLILIGLLTHAWGMFDKHRLESASAGVRLWWAEVLYWICWGALFVLALYIAVFHLRD
jgi:hypothetical protein